MNIIQFPKPGSNDFLANLNSLPQEVQEVYRARIHLDAALKRLSSAPVVDAGLKRLCIEHCTAPFF